jgi:methionyl-tRNA formyltransferase
MHSSAVKVAAEQLGIATILQPESLKSPEFFEHLSALKPDIIAVVAFRILPPSVYGLARLGAFNVHGSLLPKYRGAAPINWTIINGERETGVTSFLLAESVDTGAMLGRRIIAVPEGMTAGELHDALMPLAAELAVETCQMIASGSIKPLPQDDSIATKAPKIFREHCLIDWNKPAHEVRNFIHGMSPHPGAWTLFPAGKTLKILRVSLVEPVESAQTPPAGTYSIEQGKFTIACAHGAVRVETVQPEAKRAMAAEEFVRGYRGELQGTLEKIGQ